MWDISRLRNSSQPITLNPYIMKKLETIDLKGKAYATVPTRIKEFRADCPNGLISTSYVLQGENVVFTARILKDKANEHSAEATGHAIGPIGKGEKSFEKLETISVGRALAMLGYMAGGDVASSEEMEEFMEFQEEKWAKELEAIETMEELKAFYLANKGKGSVLDKMVKAKKDSLTTQK